MNRWKQPEWIKVRYPRTCHQCRSTIPPKARALFLPYTRRLLCHDCGKASEAKVAQFHAAHTLSTL